jgi:hypothetical protein
MQDFVHYVRSEMLTKMQQGVAGPNEGAIVALRRPVVVPPIVRKR